MRTALLALAALAISGPAFAQTKTGQFAVRASVNADCQITTRDLDFGSYAAASNTRANTSFDVRCTAGSAVTISLDGGQSGNPQQRTMTGQGANLGYQLYKDAAYQNPINTVGATWQLSNSENTGQTVTYNVYGDIPTGQAVPAGNYTDTVRVTVQY
ncbi:spore coat U domain-containing protein [Phenylobacterium sp. J367]|uniref:Csu type fimbrial protein n=1 Tax=Phenylobacterium sp. J367 TaxID=2898435 RepID=UPI0021509637|nr:spore coat U domain-containing protein [Phenylobacterium sp. J367]MCR5877508.1 spore coat U domain-containing protein [Phenylobacterium sp. J367]